MRLNDFVFLKAYVQNHPDNRMAWYLLGKEYEAAGQAGKANYCYNQAGDIYEAFERTQIPAKWVTDYVERQRVEMQKQRKRANRRRWVLLFLMLLLLIGIPGIEDNLSPLDKEVIAGDTPASDESPKIYLIPQGKPEQTKKALFDAAVVNSSSNSSRAIVLALETSGNWMLWNERPKIWATVETLKVQGNKAKSSKINIFDPKACNCEPRVPDKIQRDTASWITQTEQILTLRSAILHYKEKKGRVPARLEELAGSYPNNIIAGFTPYMKSIFIPLTTEASAKNKAMAQEEDGAVQTDPSLARGSAIKLLPKVLIQEPLKIIVDKQNYRLALVSGQVILRNYPIGLGGEKTPEGSFIISEKVKNPNGRSNGEFGSRGMTLSDTLYAIHGTDEPSSIGKDESHGCIRMGKEDVEELFDLVPIGTKVVIKKGVLPDTVVAPEQRFHVKPLQAQDQTNPRKVYKWLD